MIQNEIRERLFQLQDRGYRDFQKKLIPTVDESTIIGVRTPELRRLAKELGKREEIGDFLAELPHRYYDENQLHALIIAEEKEFGICMEETERFLPYMDNWATCDQLLPKVFQKHREELLPFIEKWIGSEHPYTVRFAIGLLMHHFLDAAFDVRYPEMVANVQSEEYYVKMMVAWYFATALAKQYDAVLPFLEKRRLDPWTQNKAIQKAVESRRITAEQKAYLKTCRVSGKKSDG